MSLKLTLKKQLNQNESLILDLVDTKAMAMSSRYESTKIRSKA